MYYPKNKILTNQYSKEGEFIYKSTNDLYMGFYWVDSTGKFFTGKNPNNKPTFELEKVKKVEDNLQENILLIAGENQDPGLNYNSPIKFNPQMVSSYKPLKDPNILKPKTLPIFHYPTPTPKDYDNGEFIRFFLKVINQDKYYEVNKQTYEAIKGQNSNWSWERFTPFKLRWKITGDKEKIKIFNQKEIGKAERDLGKEGFLKFNLLQFYK